MKGHGSYDSELTASKSEAGMRCFSFNSTVFGGVRIFEINRLYRMNTLNEE
jgi:hypothetical protein